MTRPFMRFLPGTSFAVMTLNTPGIFSASEVSTLLILAWETSAWTSASAGVPLRHGQGLVRAEVPGAGDLHGRGGTGVGRASDDRSPWA